MLVRILNARGHLVNEFWRSPIVWGILPPNRFYSGGGDGRLSSCGRLLVLAEGGVLLLEAGGVAEFPLVREPSIEVALGPGGEVHQQLGKRCQGETGSGTCEEIMVIGVQ